MMELVVNLAIIALLVAGMSQFRTPRGARLGNHAAALSLIAAVTLVVVQHGLSEPWIVAGATAIGALAGIAVAYRASMTAIPAVVALQHGMGGAAAVVVSAIELTHGAPTLSEVARVSGLFGLVLGGATLSASLLAAAKLADKIRQRPTVLPHHNLALLALLLLVALPAVGGDSVIGVAAMIVVSIGFGVVFAMRIGGADMPVLISFLNATAGLAAAFCGVAIENRLLVVVGATVASSGSILTIMMCRAMNRSLKSIFLGGPLAAPGMIGELAAKPPEPVPSPGDHVDRVARLALEARSVIVVPGYGMALAHAQFEVVRLTKLLETIGKDVRFAIHPVAGRMPGHMNVLLAEADVDYDKLVEIDDANRVFPETDLVLIVGACDVVNPAALDVEDTPLSGMPILQAHQARAIAVCNLDARPGYSGVDNPLYRAPNTLLLLGDALETVKTVHGKLLERSAIAGRATG